MCANYETAKNIVKKYNQEHLLYFYDKLNNNDKQKLIDQIMNIDFDQMNNLYKSVNLSTQSQGEEIEPISYIDKTKINVEDKERYIKIGIEAIKQGKLAAVTMAGGQGTRLRT